MAYRPLDKAELEEGLRAEVLDLPDELRRYFTRVAVAVQEVRHTDKVLFVVAKSDNRAIFYDDVEEEYGIGTVDSDNGLRNCALYGELRVALLELQTR